MDGYTSLSRSRSLSQRAGWIFAVSALALTLALGGCRSGARNGGVQTIQHTQGGAAGSTSGGSSGVAAGSSAGGSNSAALQQLQGIDNQNQSDAQQLNAAQSSAGVNYSSQQNQAQP
ncbi:MAG TPA: hypothetical protein VFN78_12165 [Ktedonobacterales bacterium]|nr:hypothetical protein [Ktedonobacterales bacterium]